MQSRVLPWVVTAMTSLTLLGSTGCHEPVPMIWKYESPAGNATAPLVTGNYLAFGHDAGVTLLNPAGDFLCNFDAHGRVAATPRSDGRLLFFGSTNHVFYAIDSTCKQVWKFTTGDRIKASPAVVGGVVYFGSADGHVYAADSASGGLRWAFPALPVAHVEVLAQAPEVGAVAAAPGGPVKGKAKVKGKQKGKGRQKAKIKDRGRLAQAGGHRAAPTPVASAAPTQPAPRDAGAFVGSAPAVADGVLYIGSTDHYLYAINVADGSLKWRFATDHEVHSPPLVADGIVYFGSRDGAVYAISANTHALVWKVPTLDEVRSQPRLVDHVLYAGGTDHHVYAIDPAKGQIRWKYETKGPVSGAVGVYKGVVLAGGGLGDGLLYALKLADQTLFWSFQTKGEVDEEPVVVEDRVYVSSSDGMIYAFSLAQAPQGEAGPGK